MLEVTCALIVNQGKILIVRNGNDSTHAFKWEFPGGKVEPGENYEQCIIREIEEELELKIEVLEPMVAISHNYGVKHINLIPFICNVVGGALKLNNHIEKHWATLSYLAKVNFSEADKVLIAVSANQEILKKYVSSN